MELNSDNIVYRADLDGWFDEIVEINGIKGVEELRTGDILYISQNTANIGPKKLLIAMENAFKYNNSMKQKMSQLSRAYIGWRPIRGDGNCFYRAVIVGLLEHIIQVQDMNGFRHLHRIFSNVHNFFSSKYEGPKLGVDHKLGLEALDLIRTKLSQAAVNGAWQSITSLEWDLNSQDSAVDSSLVLSCRLMMCQFLLTNENKDMHGLSLRDVVLSSYPDARDMESYCAKYVAEMGVDAEGPLVSGGLFLEALRCNGCMVLLDSREEVQLSVLGFTGGLQRHAVPTNRPESGSDESHVYRESSGQSNSSRDMFAPPTVHIVLRPGHYDLFYPRAEVQAKSGGTGQARAVCRLACITGGDRDSVEEDDDFVILRGDSSSSGEFETDAHGGRGVGVNSRLHSPLLVDYMDGAHAWGDSVLGQPVRVLVSYFLPTRSMGLEVHGTDFGGGLVLDPGRMTVHARSAADVVRQCRRQLNISDSRELHIVSEDLLLRTLFPNDYAHDAVFRASTGLVDGASYYLIIKDVLTVWLRVGYRMKLTPRLTSEHNQRWLLTMDVPVVFRSCRSLGESLSDVILRAVKEFTLLPPNRASSYSELSNHTAPVAQPRSQTPVPVRPSLRTMEPDTTKPLSLTAAKESLSTADVPNAASSSRPRSASVGRPRSSAHYSSATQNNSVNIKQDVSTVAWKEALSTSSLARESASCSMCDASSMLVTLRKCRHFLCSPCLEKHLTRVADGNYPKTIFFVFAAHTPGGHVQPTLRAVRCPVRGCGDFLADEDLDSLYGSELMANWVQVCLDDRGLNAEKRIVHIDTAQNTHTTPTAKAAITSPSTSSLSSPIVSPIVSPQSNSYDQSQMMSSLSIHNDSNAPNTNSQSLIKKTTDDAYKSIEIAHKSMAAAEAVISPSRHRDSPADKLEIIVPEDLLMQDMPSNDIIELQSQSRTLTPAPWPTPSATNGSPGCRSELAKEVSLTKSTDIVPVVNNAFTYGRCLACYSYSLVTTIHACKHAVCKACYLKYLTSYAASKNNHSIFFVTRDGSNLNNSYRLSPDHETKLFNPVPILCSIECPITGCVNSLWDEDVDCLYDTKEVEKWLQLCMQSVKDTNANQATNRSGWFDATSVSTASTTAGGGYGRSYDDSVRGEKPFASTIPALKGSRDSYSDTHSSITRGDYGLRGGGSDLPSIQGQPLSLDSGSRATSSTARSSSTGRLRRASGQGLSSRDYGNYGTVQIDSSSKLPAPTPIVNYEVREAARQKPVETSKASLASVEDICGDCFKMTTTYILSCKHKLCRVCLRDVRGKPHKFCPVLYCRRAISEEYQLRISQLLGQARWTDETHTPSLPPSSSTSPAAPMSAYSPTAQMPAYDQDSFATILPSPSKSLSPKPGLNQCCFFDVLMCSDRTIFDTDKRITLACGHCFHVECLLRCFEVTMKLNTERSRWPLLCPECERRKCRCLCDRCLIHGNFASFPEHIPTDSEFEEMRLKISVRVPAKMEALIRVRSRHAAAVVATSRLVNGRWVMSCRCGLTLTKLGRERVCTVCQYSYCIQCWLIGGHKGTCEDNTAIRRRLRWATNDAWRSHL